MTTIAIAVLTRSRPESLVRTLAGIAAQVVPEEPGFSVRVIVVDNDKTGSAFEACEGMRSKLPWPLDYAVEPVLGIARSRNRALHMASDAEFIAFVDDDEVPDPNWISELFLVQREFGADVVLGPVLPYFPETVPRWIHLGNFFGRPRFATGTVRQDGGAGNALIAMNAVGTGMLFDESLGLTGGEDIDFFRRLTAAGKKIVWADDAVAMEWVPKSRATVKWLAMRNFRCGTTIVLITERRSVARFRLAVQGLVRVLLGGAGAALLLPFGIHRSVRSLRSASFGLGVVYGLAGYQFEEYRHIHGK
jgi:succinoglycan biosynthesis protein ExoM